MVPAMDKEEASVILEKALADVGSRSYVYFAQVAGQDLVESTAGASGANYRVVIQPVLYSEAGMADWIEVDVTVMEEKSRTWLGAQLAPSISGSITLPSGNEET